MGLINKLKIYKGTREKIQQQTLEADAFYLADPQFAGNKFLGTDNDGDLVEKDLPTLQGATSAAAGSAGIAPAPAAGDEGKFLRGDGTWSEAGGSADLPFDEIGEGLEVVRETPITDPNYVAVEYIAGDGTNFSFDPTMYDIGEIEGLDFKDIYFYWEAKVDINSFGSTNEGLFYGGFGGATVQTFSGQLKNDGSLYVYVKDEFTSAIRVEKTINLTVKDDTLISLKTEKNSSIIDIYQDGVLVDSLDYGNWLETLEGFTTMGIPAKSYVRFKKIEIEGGISTKDSKEIHRVFIPAKQINILPEAYGVYCPNAAGEGGGPAGPKFYTNEHIVGGPEVSKILTTTVFSTGKKGNVPAPTTADKDKFLKGDGTWATVNVDHPFTEVGNGLSITTIGNITDPNYTEAEWVSSDGSHDIVVNCYNAPKEILQFSSGTFNFVIKLEYDNTIKSQTLFDLVIHGMTSGEEQHLVFSYNQNGGLQLTDGQETAYINFTNPDKNKVITISKGTGSQINITEAKEMYVVGTLFMQNQDLMMGFVKNMVIKGSAVSPIQFTNFSFSGNNIQKNFIPAIENATGKVGYYCSNAIKVDKTTYSAAFFGNEYATHGTLIPMRKVLDSKVFTGATSTEPGQYGAVPTPAAGDEDKFLKADGTWAVAGGSVDIDDATIKKNTDNKLYAVQMTGATDSANGVAGIVPAPSTTDKEYFLKGDGTWGRPAVDGDVIVYGVNGQITAMPFNGAYEGGDGTAGIVPAPYEYEMGNFLCGNGSWMPIDTSRKYFGTRDLDDLLDPGAWFGDASEITHLPATGMKYVEIDAYFVDKGESFIFTHKVTDISPDGSGNVYVREQKPGWAGWTEWKKISGGSAQVQVDYAQTDTTAVDYIKNKPAVYNATGQNTDGYMTQKAVTDAIGSLTKFDVVLVDTLPTTGVTGTIYLLKATKPDGTEYRKEYIWVEDSTKAEGGYFEQIGETVVEINDMTGATTTSDGEHGLVPKPLTTDVGKVLGAGGSWVAMPEIEIIELV